MKEQLLSIISHEFRIPLSIIMSSSAILTKYYDRLPAEQRKEKIANIMRQIHRLDEMLEDVSTLSVGNRGFLQYHPEPTNVISLCHLIIDEIADTMTTNHKLELKCSVQSGQATLDKKLMYHALTNLISNAVKYSSQGGEIKLSVTQTAAEWKFSVEDHGMGIPESDQSALFTPFNRAGNVGNIAGTGLGLFIVREIAERHGGSVRVESQVGVGSTFTIVIPVDVARE